MKKPIDELANGIIELYQDYDPYDFDGNVISAGKIIEAISRKDTGLIQDLANMAQYCLDSDDYDFYIRILSMLIEIAKWYK